MKNEGKTRQPAPHAQSKLAPRLFVRKAHPQISSAGLETSATWIRNLRISSSAPAIVPNQKPAPKISCHPEPQTKATGIHWSLTDGAEAFKPLNATGIHWSLTEGAEAFKPLKATDIHWSLTEGAEAFKPLNATGIHWSLTDGAEAFKPLKATGIHWSLTEGAEAFRPLNATGIHWSLTEGAEAFRPLNAVLKDRRL